jgi:hypothetical protein
MNALCAACVWQSTVVFNSTAHAIDVLEVLLAAVAAAPAVETNHRQKSVNRSTLRKAAFLI